MLNALGRSSQLQILLSGELEFTISNWEESKNKLPNKPPFHQLTRFRVRSNKWNLSCNMLKHETYPPHMGIVPQNRDENDEKQYPSLVAATLIHQSHHAIPQFSGLRKKSKVERNRSISSSISPPFWRVTNSNASTQKGFLQSIPKNLLLLYICNSCVGLSGFFQFENSSVLLSICSKKKLFVNSAQLGSSSEISTQEASALASAEHSQSTSKWQKINPSNRRCCRLITDLGNQIMFLTCEEFGNFADVLQRIWKKSAFVLDLFSNLNSFSWFTGENGSTVPRCQRLNVNDIQHHEKRIQRLLQAAWRTSLPQEIGLGNNITWKEKLRKTESKFQNHFKPHKSYLSRISQNTSLKKISIYIYNKHFSSRLPALEFPSAGGSFKNSRSKIVFEKTKNDRVLVVLGSIGPFIWRCSYIKSFVEWRMISAYSTISALSVRHFYGSSSAFCARSYKWSSVQDYFQHALVTLCFCQASKQS